MTFWKAEQLLDLATLAAARHAGIVIPDVIERFDVSKRTAQRMLHAMEELFPEVQTIVDSDGRKRWRLPAAPLRDLLTLSAEEIAALDLAIETFNRMGLSSEGEELVALREKILALVPRSKAARLETDHEALLEAQGFATRPGPKQRINRKIAASISEAIKANRLLVVDYSSRRNQGTRKRVLAPYGLLTGIRRYLVAKPAEDTDGGARLYILENIKTAVVSDKSFIRDPSFNLSDFANRSFGVFQSPDEYGEVVWKFVPSVADHASSFEFHPSQYLERLADGSLLVRFRAAGHLEMAWHLYMWGDKVEVLAPRSLRQWVQEHRRSDFPSPP